MNTRTLLRYPGVKSHSVFGPMISGRLPKVLTDFGEPFIGAGAVTLYLDRVGQIAPGAVIRFNDVDPSLCALWRTTLFNPAELCERIRGYERPVVDDYYTFRESDNDGTLSDVERGFRKLVLHQISFNGQGTESCPIGGKNQSGAWKVDYCWKTQNVVERITDIHERLKKYDVRVTNQNALTVLDSSEWIYCDPPYFDVGDTLYKYDFARYHRDLADALHRRGRQWILSYNRCGEILFLYRHDQRDDVRVASKVQNKHVTKQVNDNRREWLITPK